MERVTHSWPSCIALIEVVRKFRDDAPTGDRESKRWREEVVKHALEFASEEKAVVTAAAGAIADLYCELDAGTVRGCVLEALTYSRLRARYSESHQLLRDNVSFVVDHRTSPFDVETPVDVIAFDAQDDLGECLECRCDGGRFDTEKIKALAQGLGPRGIAFGLVTTGTTASNRRYARRFEGVELTVIGYDELESALPLRPVSRSLLEQTRPTEGG